MRKQTVVVVVISLVCVIPISTSAQVLRFLVERSNTSIRLVLQELERRGECTSFYNDNQVKLDRRVSISIEDAPIEAALNQVLENSGCSYRIVENQVVAYTIPTTTAQQTAQQ